MSDKPIKREDEAKAIDFTLKARKLKIWGLILLVFAASNFTTYHWQHSRATKAQQNLSTAESSLSTANKKLRTSGALLLSDGKSLTDLQQKYQDVQSQSATQQKNNSQASEASEPLVMPTQADLDLTVDGAITTYFTEYGANFIGINLTLKNNTKSNIDISPNAYGLKDMNNHVFTTNEPGGGFGKDYVPLAVQTLAPWTSVTGSIGFLVSDYTVTDYTLSIGSHTYSITATKADQEWPLN